MPVIEALMIALSGFIVVFLMLVLLWGIVVMISKAVSAAERKNAPALSGNPFAADTADEPVREEKKHEVYGGEIALYDVDEKTAACIMAIVSDSSGIPLENLIFRSIRALD